MNGQNREDVKIGSRVEVALKTDQKTGMLTYGIVVEILWKISRKIFKEKMKLPTRYGRGLKI